MALYPPTPPILPPAPRQRPSMAAPTLNAPPKPIMAPPLGAPPVLPPKPALAQPQWHGAPPFHPPDFHPRRRGARPMEANSFAAPGPQEPPEIERAIARRNRKPQPY